MQESIELTSVFIHLGKDNIIKQLFLVRDGLCNISDARVECI